MSRWFRHYAGMMRDEKLVRVAVKAAQPIERVIWVWGALLESASEVNDGGSYDFDADEAAYFLRCERADVCSILDGLEGSDRIHEGVIVRWGDRQFDSDSSRERQRRYREKQKANDHDTSAIRHSDGDRPSPNVTVTGQEYRDREHITTDDARARAPPSNEVSKNEEGELFAVAGKALSSSPSLFVMAVPMGWKEAGMDWLLDVIPAVRTAAQRCDPGAVQSWNYFSKAVADWHAKRTALMPVGNANGRAQNAPKRTTADFGRQVAAELRERENAAERDSGTGLPAVVELSRAG